MAAPLAAKDAPRAIAYWLYGPAPSSAGSKAGAAGTTAVVALLLGDPRLRQRYALVRRFLGSDNRANAYRAFDLKKKRGGSRTIHAPVRPLRGLQRRLAAAVTAITKRHGSVHGFEPGRSIVTNAESHVRKRWVYTVDLEDFFPSISWGRVYGMLQEYPANMPEPIARAIANLATYDGALPQGAPTSPVLANLVCRRLDASLHRLAKERGFVYTRYADDLTFSTNKAEVSAEDQEAIEAVVNDEGFKLNPSKRRLMPSTGRQMVTGLVVNRKVNVPKHFVKGLRALLNNVDRYGWESQTDRNFAFASWEAWEDYRTGSLNTKEEREVRERQRKRKLLMNPRARIPTASGSPRRPEVSADRGQQARLLTEAMREQQRQTRALQRVVAGRLAFLRMVRGEAHPEYERLLDQYRYLRSRADTERKSYDEHRREVLAFDPGYDARKGLYRPFGKGKIEALDEGALDALIAERADDVLEFAWLSGDSSERRTAAQRVAFRAYLCSPRLTAGFAAAFKERDGFEGLLHKPSPTSPPAADLVARAQGQVLAYKGLIPNELYDACTDFLNACQRHVGAKGWHPMTDAAFYRDYVGPFKKAVRFGRDESVFQLHLYLQEAAEAANKARTGSGNGEVKLSIDPSSTLFTHTENVADALRRIVVSLVEKTTAQAPEVTFKAERKPSDEGSLPRTIYRAEAEGVVLPGTPSLEDLFGGDMREAVELLRGYADWTISAPFADGRSYQFDVMRNARTDLATPVGAITHVITLYRTK